jgi:pimeloyl-ACP methyl ester carboxylesterase
VTRVGEVQVDDARLHFEILGSGPDTLLVVSGGFAFSHQYLREPLEKLAPRYTVILYDGRRRGQSASSAGDSLPLTPARDARDLEAVRAYFRISRFALVAHHSGAFVATNYIRAHPDPVTRLVLIGPMYPRITYNWDLMNLPRDTGAASAIGRLYASGLREADPHAWCLATWGWTLGPAQELDDQLRRRLGPMICTSPDSALARRDLIKQELLTALRAWDYRDSLPAIAVPLLVIEGDREPVLAHAARTWAYRAPSGRVLLARGSPHFPWVTDARRVREGLGVFLAGRWPDDAHRPQGAEVASPDDSERQDHATRSGSSP